MSRNLMTTEPVHPQPLRTEWVAVDTPIGILTVEGHERAVTRIDLPVSTSRKARPFPTRSAHRDGSHSPGEPVLEALRQLEEYFKGDRKEFDLPIEVSGSAFQKDVWLSLAEIPYGETVSYAELAMMVGRPRACRAVGQANGANPIPIVLPCHRVIASGGKIGGYGGGLDTKRQLLELEGAHWAQ